MIRLVVLVGVGWRGEGGGVGGMGTVQSRPDVFCVLCLNVTVPVFAHISPGKLILPFPSIRNIRLFPVHYIFLKCVCKIMIISVTCTSKRKARRTHVLYNTLLKNEPEK
jgi:hypothetical protein